MNYNHHIIFNCIDFVSSHYVNDINMDIVQFFSVFNKFDFAFQYDILLV